MIYVVISSCTFKCDVLKGMQTQHLFWWNFVKSLCKIDIISSSFKKEDLILRNQFFRVFVVAFSTIFSPNWNGSDTERVISKQQVNFNSRSLKWERYCKLNLYTLNSREYYNAILPQRQINLISFSSVLISRRTTLQSIKYIFMMYLHYFTWISFKSLCLMPQDVL